MRLLRRLFLHDVGLKVTSLLLSCLLWFQIAGRDTVQRTINVPIEFINIPPQLEISNEYVRTVDVTIRRPSTLRIDEGQLAVVVDMSESRPGTEVVPLTERNIEVPFAVQVESITPPRMRLVLEKTQWKSVKIEPEVIGQPAEGYQLFDVRLSPSETVIRGPESRVSAILKADTAPIDITGRDETFTTRVFLDLEDPALRIDTAPSTEALVIIEEARKAVELGSFMVALDGSDRRAVFSPRTVKVSGTVPISFDEELDASLFRVVLKLPEDGDPFEAGAKFELEPILVISEEYRSIFRVEAIEPPVVSVTLR